jgi:crotonobetainyl-CoA:carnitine CoA-transferase CaiB-like acyl-CoA transferase
VSDTSPQKRPFLQGIRVLDVTEALAGPFCTAILSDLGADVVKIERIGGDGLRARGRKDGGRSFPFEMVQRGKRAVALDFTRPEGAELLMRLAGTFDVLVENFKPGVLAKYGLDAAAMLEQHPALVYASISGFGQTGPLRAEKGVDLISQGFGGLLSVTGSADGTPAKAGYAVSDVGSGMWAAIGILAALQRRAVTGEGACIDVGLSDTIASWAVWEVADFQISGAIPGPLGTAHRLTAPYQAFLCGDGKWLTMAGLDRQMQRFCEVIGLPDLLENERFATEYERFKHREELAAILSEAFSAAGRDEWISRLREIGIPSGPVNDISDMLADEQYEARGMFPQVTDEHGTVRLVNTPIIADGAPRIRTLAPAMGAHTVPVLIELGLTGTEIEELLQQGIVASAVGPVSS